MKSMNMHEDKLCSQRSLTSKVLSALCKRLINSADNPRGCLLGAIYEPSLPHELISEIDAES